MLWHDSGFEVFLFFNFLLFFQFFIYLFLSLGFVFSEHFREMNVYISA